jgi:hypothetical protein
MPTHKTEPTGWGMDRAISSARRIVAMQSAIDGDRESAMRSLETHYGIGFWPLWHLCKGKAKTCDLSLFGKMQAAYLDLCAKQVAKLQHDIFIEKALGDDTLEDLERKAAALASEIAARKAAI